MLSAKQKQPTVVQFVYVNEHEHEHEHEHDGACDPYPDFPVLNFSPPSLNGSC